MTICETSVIVPVMLNVMVSPEAASSTAWRSVPAPEFAVLVTSMTAARAGSANAALPSRASQQAGKQHEMKDGFRMGWMHGGPPLWN